MNVSVLRGGPSAKYDTSLKTGEYVLSILRKEPEKYKLKDVFISRDGLWHAEGRKYEPYQALRGTDLVWNALHDKSVGESEIGQLLNNLHLPHTGSSTFGLALSQNKDLVKQAYITHSIPTPRYEVLGGGVGVEDLMRIFRTFLHPVVVKPVHGVEASIASLAQTFDELKEAVASAFKHAERVMVEELVRGTSASCAVVEGLRGEKLYSLLPQPAKWKSEEHKLMEHYARRAHEALGLRHYSVSSFIVTPKGKIYITETDALPEVTKSSDLTKSLALTGITPKEFVEHVISISK
ncbi:hypothetical protein KW800_00480 [Candidatus Parcubacteria bacterium]|nr:hypothetical protein [Candidatus Parcubacteria bacterium]